MHQYSVLFNTKALPADHDNALLIIRKSARVLSVEIRKKMDENVQKKRYIHTQVAF